MVSSRSIVNDSKQWSTNCPVRLARDDNSCDNGETFTSSLVIHFFPTGDSGQEIKVALEIAAADKKTVQTNSSSFFQQYLRK